MGVHERVWTRERARSQGVSRERLTGGVEFVRVAPGHYLEACWADDLPSRCAAVQLAAPRAVLSHWTALSLNGLPTPAAGSGVTGAAPLHVTVPGTAARPGWPGVVAHRSAYLPSFALHGLRVTGAVRSWCDCAALVAAAEVRPGAAVGVGVGVAPRATGAVRPVRADLVVTGDLADLVAAGDALVGRRPTTLRDIGIVLGSRSGGRGAQLARQASRLLDARAESAQESRLRVVLTLAGLPPPAVQHEVRTRSGAFVARVDLAYPARRLAVEYDGDHHRGRRQWRHDLARREALEALGWRLLVVTAADLHGDPTAVVTRVRAALSTRR